MVTPKNPNTKLARAALGYAQRQHWLIFPLVSRSKDPAISKWPHRASNDPAIVKAWWSDNPNFNIGLLTGPESGVVLVDLDVKSGGLDSWSELQDIHGPVDTLSSITGSGGGHLFFLQPEGVDLRNTAGNLARGIDTRGWHGYAILPPSIHPSGGRYEWDNVRPPAPLPQWLLDKWVAITPSEGNNGGAPRGEPLSEYLREFVVDLCANQWGLKLQRNGEYSGTCPYPHLFGPCECPKAFYVSPDTGFWRCFCSDHQKIETKLVAAGWVVRGSRHKPDVASHAPAASLSEYIRCEAEND